MKAEVLLPKVFNFPFTYNSNNISLKTGDLVEIPFGKSQEIGVIWKNKNIELNKNIKIKLMCRIETIKELEYFKAGGILQYVFNSIVKKAS